MSLFPKNSAFDTAPGNPGFAPYEGRVTGGNPDLDAEVARQEMERLAASPVPIEHWHHDLNTIDILLDQDPPELDRARAMVREVRDEMYRRLR